MIRSLAQGWRLDRDVPDTALTRRVIDELDTFVSWLDGATGFVGEVGWPRSKAWTFVAEAWLRQAAAAGLWITTWSTGVIWPENSLLLTYSSSTGTSRDGHVDTLEPGAAALERHTGANVGVNVTGGAWGRTKAGFSNDSPGVYETNWWYERQETFDFLAARGHGLVRIGFNWERIQPALGAALDTTELGRLTDVVNRAGLAGLGVVLDLHNGCSYYLNESGTITQYHCGDAQLPWSYLVDLWERLATAFAGNAHVRAYGLMNEPSSLPAADPEATWETQSQAIVDAIRAIDTTTPVAVALYGFDTLRLAPTKHPSGPWIVDDHVVYEPHHYWDRATTSGGNYGSSIEDEITDSVTRGY